MLEELYWEVLQQILKFLVCELLWMILNLMFHHLLSFTTVNTGAQGDPARSNLKHLNETHTMWKFYSKFLSFMTQCVFRQKEAVITGCSFKQYKEWTYGVEVSKARGRKGHYFLLRKICGGCCIRNVN